ncbi:MAG: group 1 hemoglobin [Nevskia sp.]|nr:group 1 hemoglobin [Nevskia sp.]
MKAIRLSLTLAAATTLMLAAAQPAVAAQDPTGGKQTTYPGIPSSSLEKFGGEAGVAVWVDDLFYYILADNRINQIFLTHGKVKRQIALNKELEQMVLGGPVTYEGASMSAAHSDMGITLTQFNAVVEDAYLACDLARTPYTVCNQLIAALAPFERSIVTR